MEVVCIEYWTSIIQLVASVFALATTLFAGFLINNWYKNHVQQKKMDIAEECLRHFSRIEIDLGKVFDANFHNFKMEDMPKDTHVSPDVIDCLSDRIDYHIDLAKKVLPAIEHLAVLESAANVWLGNDAVTAFSQMRLAYAKIMLFLETKKYETGYLFDDSMAGRVSYESVRERYWNIVCEFNNKFYEYPTLGLMPKRASHEMRLGVVDAMESMNSVARKAVSRKGIVKTFNDFIDWLNCRSDEFQSLDRCMACNEKEKIVSSK